MPGADAAADVGPGAGAARLQRRHAQEFRSALVSGRGADRGDGRQGLSRQLRQGLGDRGPRRGGAGRGRRDFPRRHPGRGRPHPRQWRPRAQRLRARQDGRARRRRAPTRPSTASAGRTASAAATSAGGRWRGARKRREREQDLRAGARRRRRARAGAYRGARGARRDGRAARRHRRHLDRRADRGGLRRRHVGQGDPPLRDRAGAQSRRGVAPADRGARRHLRQPVRRRLRQRDADRCREILRAVHARNVPDGIRRAANPAHRHRLRSLPPPAGAVFLRAACVLRSPPRSRCRPWCGRWSSTTRF